MPEISGQFITKKDGNSKMSHEISVIDMQEGTEMAWHKLTQIRPVITLADNFLARWDIRKRPLFLGNADRKAIATDFSILGVTDLPELTIGNPINNSTYQPISNADFLATIGEALKEKEFDGAIISSVGSVCERGRVFVSVKLPSFSEYEVAGRNFKSHLNFMNSHDQSTPFVVNSSNICTVCNNTFTANLTANDSAVRISLKHTKFVKQRLDNVPEIIAGYLGAQEKFMIEFGKMHKRKITIQSAQELFTAFIGADKDGEMGTRKQNQVNRLCYLFGRGKGNKGETVADAFSAITDYYTHESAGGSDILKQLISSEYGTGNKEKGRAFNLLADHDQTVALMSQGQEILKQLRA